MGASKPATYGRFKTSHQFQGFAFPFSLYPPSFPVQSIRNRLGFLFPPEARASRRHNIPADDRSPGCESHPDRLKPPLVRALRAGGALAGKDGPGGGGNLGDESMAAWLTRRYGDGNKNRLRWTRTCVCVDDRKGRNCASFVSERQRVRNLSGCGQAHLRRGRRFSSGIAGVLPLCS